MTRRRPARVLATLVVASIVVPLAACTQDEVDPERARTVVVAVDNAVGSLNAGLPEGRTAGSTLLRGLVADGFTSLDETGAAVSDPAFGTVEKVADEPLTVRYTIAEGARWSDGVPVSPADLLLEWAARSGQFDEAEPGEVRLPTPTPTPDSVTPSPTPTPTTSPTPSRTTAAPDLRVRFGATSAALVAASATPTLDEHGLTLVYDHPVADWQVALDVNLPAHVVGRLALAGDETPTPRGTGTPEEPAATPTATGTADPSAAGSWADDPWAAAVADAIVGVDRPALALIAQTWHSGFGAEALAADPERAVTTGPYRIEAFDTGGSVTLVPNTTYVGARPASRERIVLRWDLDPLDAIDALASGDADLAAPVVTPDVNAAIYRLDDAQVSTGGGAVFQLALNEASGPFSPSDYRGSDAATTAGTVRAAFLAVAADAELAAAAGAAPSSAVLAVAGPERLTEPPVSSVKADLTDAGIDGTVPVRVLVATGDPVRAAILEALAEAALAAGFVLEEATPDDVTAALVDERDVWDAALVPVTQSELPVAGTADRWRTGGTTNITATSGVELDELLDRLVGAVNPNQASALLDQVGVAVRDRSAVLPITRQPSIAATMDRAADSRLPRLGAIPAVPWGDADLSSWWSWAVQTAG